MGDTSGCQINSNNLAVYIQGVSVTPSSNVTSEYFVTGSLPSSASTKRVWSFTTQGTLSGSQGTLTLDYAEAKENCPLYNITFEGKLNGTYTVKNQVFSANKFISYQFNGDTILTLTVKVPKTILNCYGSEDPLPYYFTTNINDASSSSAENLVYGTDSSGSGYNYTVSSGTPDSLSVSSTLSFGWLSITQGDVVDVQFGSGTNGTILYYGGYDYSYYFEYTGDSASAISVVYFADVYGNNNWPFYYDYTALSNNNGGDYTFYSGGTQNSTFVTVNNYNTPNTFSFTSSTPGGTNEFSVVVGNISSGDTFYVQSATTFKISVNVYDTSGNVISFDTSGSKTLTLNYTGSGWTIPNISLVYGTTTNNPGYFDYVASSGSPDTLTVYSNFSLNFCWILISERDVVDVQFEGSGTEGSKLIYGPITSTYLVEYTAPANGYSSTSVVYFADVSGNNNWPFYYDYTSPSMDNGGNFIFYSGGEKYTTYVTVNSTDALGTFSFSSSTSGGTNDVSVVVGNITNGKTFNVQSDVSGFSMNVSVFDISGNNYSYTTEGNITTSLNYTGNGWSIT